MTPTDYVFIAVDLALWAAVTWHRTQAKAVGELWWSCVGIALLITMKIGVIAHPFNQVTGGVYLDELLGHLAGVVVISLTVSWLVLIRYGSRQPYRKLRLGSTVALLAFLIATWFLAPIYGIPATEGWIPDVVLNSPMLIIHWSVLNVALLTFCVVFLRLAGAEARTLPPGYVRLSIRLLIVAAGLLSLTSATGLVTAGIKLGGGSKSEVVLFVQNVLLLGVFALFLLAIALPLARGRRGDDADGDTTERVASLWAWIQSAGRGESGGEHHTATLDAGESLMDQVIDIRDRMWWLQRFVSPADLAAASRQARAEGLLFGTRARAYVAAACLHLAAERGGGNGQPVAPPPANLSRLGGGRTIGQEAYWLAAVSDALTTRLGRYASATRVQ